MNCKNCIFYNVETETCDVGATPDDCESFEEVLDMNDLGFLDDVMED